MYHREERIALPAEVGIDAEHKADHDAVDAIAVQVARTHLDHGFIVRKDAGQRVRQKLRINAEADAEHQGHADARPQATVHAVGQARSIVLRRHGSNGGRHGRRRQHGKNNNLLHHAKPGRSNDAHPVDNDRDDQERDIDKRVLQGNGSAQGQDPLGEPSVQPDIPARELEPEATAMQIPQGGQETDALRGHRGNGCSHGPQMEPAHQQEVQSHIDDTSLRHEVERRPRIAQTAQDAAHHVISDDERDAQRTDKQVMLRIAQGLDRRMHQHGYRIVQEGHQQRQPHAHNAEQPDGRADDGGQFAIVARAGGNAYQHGDARGQSQDDARHCLHHLATDGHARHTGRIVKLPHYEQVRTAIQGLQHIGQQIGHGKLKQHTGHAALRQIKFFLHTSYIYLLHIKSIHRIG